PPLYWALLKLWMALAGQSELALRFVSLAATVMIVAITFRLGLLLFRREEWRVRSTLIVAALIGFSPFLLLYGRMIRSYALFTLLTTAATWALLRLESKLTFGRWLAYVVLAAALLYTDYGAWAVLGAQGLWIIARPHRSPTTSSEQNESGWRPVRSRLIPLSA